MSAARMFRDASTAVLLLKRTLEDDSSPENPRYSGFITGASMWIIHAGQWLFMEVVLSPRAMSGSENGKWGNGALYTGPILGLERWVFWRKAFEDAKEKTSLSEETRGLAQKAANFMNALESLNA